MLLPRLDRLVSEQARILDFAAPLLAPGGLLVYATCALTDREGRDQVDAFLARQAGWSAEPIEADMGRAHGHGLLLTPGTLTLENRNGGGLVATITLPRIPA